MQGVRMNALASLQRTIGHLENATSGSQGARPVALGHVAADAALHGGLRPNALHEVFALETRQSAAATGFALGLAARLSRTRTLFWVQQDFSTFEAGNLWMTGIADLGLDPRNVVMVRVSDSVMALRVAADALACDALGAVLLDLWGDVKAFDLVASRKLSLTARQSGVSCIMMRTSARPAISTAETRWIVNAARSKVTPITPAWGTPFFQTTLVRNRHGHTGQWLMEWNCDECLFRDVSTYPQPVAAAPFDRSYQATIIARNEIIRRVG